MKAKKADPLKKEHLMSSSEQRREPADQRPWRESFKHGRKVQCAAV